MEMPEFSKMIDAVKRARKAKCLVVRKNDRLIRDV